MELERRGIATVLWFPDAISNLGALWMFRAPYSAMFFKEPALVRTLRATYGYNAHYLPECCDPEIHKPQLGERLNSIAVVGNMYATRVRLLDQLHSDGIPLALYGTSSPLIAGTSLQSMHVGKYLRGIEKAKVFHNSIAVLNNMHPAEIEGVNARLFEATACGAITVSEFKSELPKMFDLDREVLAFRTYDELLSTLRGLVAGELGGREIGDAASRRCHSDHTYGQRLETLIEVVLG